MTHHANWFIGLPVAEPPQLDQVLLTCPPELRRFHPSDLHVTVAFLGPVGADRARRAWEQLGDIDTGPFTVTLGALLPFGRRGRPSAFAFELSQGADAVAELIRQKENLLRQAAGLRPESRQRSPRPHITVARPGRRATPQVREAALRWAETVTPPAQPLRLDRVALYTWSRDRNIKLFDIVTQRSFRSGLRD